MYAIHYEILYGKSVYRHLKRTKGYHMVDIMNELDVDCAVYGNHEFDFGIGPLQAGLTGHNTTSFDYIYSISSVR